MLEPDWSQDKPAADPAAMWAELSFTPVPYTEAAIDEVLALLRKARVNGDAFMRCFTVSAHQTFDWFASRNRLEEIDFFSHFLTNAAVVATLPEMVIDPGQLATTKFSRRSAFTLDGEIAELLVSGGAYEQFEGSPAQAKAIGSRFCHAIFGERYTEVESYHTADPWSNWFFGIAWDETYVLLDKGSRKVWLLCTTDTD
jgi:hypothetical protein